MEVNKFAHIEFIHFRFFDHLIGPSLLHDVVSFAQGGGIYWRSRVGVNNFPAVVVHIKCPTQDSKPGHLSMSWGD